MSDSKSVEVVSTAAAVKYAVNGQRRTLGDFELTIFSDGHYFLDGGAFFGIIPRVMWEKKMRADAKNRLTVGLNSLLVRTGKQTVLVETGIGDKFDQRTARNYAPEAHLLDHLSAAGVSPEEIDVVINTHLHFDHCGWNTVRKHGRIVATFPRAKYYVQEGEWQHGQKQTVRDRISYISDNYNPLIESGRMQLLQGDSEIVPGISVKVFPGHTRHMQAVVLQSNGQHACYISDLIPTTAHLDLTWGMGYDLFPVEVIESKKRFYAEAVPDRWLVIFTHDPVTPWCHVERSGRGKFIPRPV